MKKLALASALLILQTVTAHAHKLVILTNEPGSAKAIEIRALLKSIPPFSHLRSDEFEIGIEQVNMERENIKCGALEVKMGDEERKQLEAWSKANRICLSPKEINLYKKGYKIARNITCDTPKLASLGARYGGDQTMLVLNHEGNGGSGGEVPIVYTGTKVTVAIHELLHTYGLADEYEYRREEAPAYCRYTLWSNVGIFEDHATYANNADAISQHSHQIPWMSHLGKDPNITFGNKLGTAFAERLGLFPSRTCNEISMKSWKATAYPTIMEKLESKWIPKTMWPAILNGMHISRERQSEVLRKPDLPQKDRMVPHPKMQQKDVIFYTPGARPKC